MAQIIDATNEKDGYLAQGALPAAIWNAPEVLAAGIEAGDTTDENIAEAMTTLNNAIENVA